MLLMGDCGFLTMRQPSMAGSQDSKIGCMRGGQQYMFVNSCMWINFPPNVLCCSVTQCDQRFKKMWLTSFMCLRESTCPTLPSWELAIGWEVACDQIGEKNTVGTKTLHILSCRDHVGYRSQFNKHGCKNRQSTVPKMF